MPVTKNKPFSLKNLESRLVIIVSLLTITGVVIGMLIYFIQVSVKLEKLNELEKSIVDLKNEINDLEQKTTDTNKRIDSLYINMPNNNNNIDEKPKLLSNLNIHIGLMEEKKEKNKLSSYGYKYHYNKNICEINAASSIWKDYGGLPLKGQFLEIINGSTGLKTWAFIIGIFSDYINTNRLIIISSKTASDLSFPPGAGIITGNVSIMTTDQWRENNEAIKLYEQVYKIK